MTRCDRRHGFCRTDPSRIQDSSRARQSRGELAHAHWRSWKAHLGQAAADAVLPREERRAARGARLLAVIVQEPDAFVRNAVDVGRLVAHQSAGVATEIGKPDVVTPDDEDVRFVRLRHAESSREISWRPASRGAVVRPLVTQPRSRIWAPLRIQSRSSAYKAYTNC